MDATDPAAGSHTPGPWELDPRAAGQPDAGETAQLDLETMIAMAHRVLILQMKLLRQLEQARNGVRGLPASEPASVPGPGPAPEQRTEPIAELVHQDGGDLWLTSQQRKVLALIGQGMSNRRIARTLGIAENTVKNYVHAIFQKLGLQCRVEAALYAQRHGLLADEHHLRPPG
ncbi:response regulator transcription factor [Spirillospora sp. NPDC048911]|uniref:response regulator transcription factor n=1 Tax=Spirillospora sp. NPDC048911 TaxID=3364527 RepID=UPI0037240534